MAVSEQPLGEFLDDLRRQRHLPLHADTSTRDERVTLFARERDLGDVLELVARHFDYTWQRRHRAGKVEYLLTQIEEQRRREEALRHAALEKELESLREQMASRLADARLTPEERRARQVDRMRQRLDSLPREEQRRQQEESIDALQRGEYRHIEPSAEGDAFEAAILAMGPADWEAFWRGESFQFAYPPRPGRKNLDARQAAAMVRTEVESRGAVRTLEGTYRPAPFAGVERVRGEMGLGLKNGHASVRFRCRFVARQPERRLGCAVFQETTSLAAYTPPPSELAVDPEDADLKRTVDLPAGDRPASAVPQMRTVADVLGALAPACSYTLIADAYDDRRSDVVAFTPGPRRLDAWLREWCSPLGLRARREGSILAFRRVEWARLRPLQVPDRLSRPWEATLRRQPALPLRQLAEIAGHASDDQIEMLLNRWKDRGILPEGGYWLLQSSFERSADALRLLATLSPDEWSRALRPTHPEVPLGKPAQRQIVLRWFTGPSSAQWTSEQPATSEYKGTPDAFLDAEERLEGGRARTCLQLFPTPCTFYVDQEWFYVAAEDPLQPDVFHSVIPEQLRDKLPPIHGTQYLLGLSAEPRTPVGLAGFQFITSDPAPRKALHGGMPIGPGDGGRR